MDYNHNTFEETLLKNLYSYLKLMGEVDTVMPDAPDIEDCWEKIGSAYLPDGIREFQDYPLTSLGWITYVGMAVAQMWDMDWTRYSQHDDLYALLRDKRGFDEMDEHIAQDWLALDETKQNELSTLVGNLAARTYNYLMHQGLEPGTAQAMKAYVACLHQLYIMGACMQLHRLGYHMTALN